VVDLRRVFRGLGSLVLAASALLLLGAPARAAPAARAARVLVDKRAHTLTLFDGRGDVIAVFPVSLGPGGSGPKQREGDMRTPVGRYHVTMHQPSVYKVFLRLDYPNREDWARFRRLEREGELPKGARIGGDIGIHGGTAPSLRGQDWTLGCVAVDDAQIAEIARLVPDGTVVDIEE
jgi:murein L,D-transpeptidase YafK